MSVIGRLSSSLGRRDQAPNKQVASEIVSTHDTASVAELVHILQEPLSEPILFDALKVLAEVGEKKPELAAPSFHMVLPHLQHLSQKIKWMAMSALSNVAGLYPKEAFHQLAGILKIMDGDSVIARDKGMKILVDLYSNYPEELAALILEQILQAPHNQLGQYAERWMTCIQTQHVPALIQGLESKEPELSHESHRKRLAKNLKKLYKLNLHD